MKRIILKKLRIENFKGCRERNIDFGNTTNIYGANASGKTTVFDAFTWLLFGKDSSGTEKFNIRPLDAAGNTVDNVEILVEAVLDVDGKEEALQKVQKQNWVKKRGTDVVTLQGNVNTYEINSFPAGEKEFKEHIAGIISEDLFKLLTDPRAFASFPWKKQREILMQFISEVTDADVLAIDSVKYAPIADDVLAAPVEKCIEKAKEAMLKLKDRQKELPARIDEASRSIVEIPDLSDLELQRNALNEQLVEVQKQRDDSSGAYNAVKAIQDEIRKTQAKAFEIKQRADNQLAERRTAARNAHADIQRRNMDLMNERKDKESQVGYLCRRLAEKEKEREKFAAEWKDARAAEMDVRETVCPVCGRPFEADKINDIKDQFEKNKSSKIEKITEAGKKAKEEIDAMRNQAVDLKNEIAELKRQWTEGAARERKAYEELGLIPDSADMAGDQEYQELQSKLSDLNTQLRNMDTGEAARQQLNIRERGIREELSAVNKQFAAVDANERIQERIDELKAEQKDIAQKVANQEQKIFLLEEFSRAKMDVLSRDINGQFKNVNFKLFEMQLNGGMKDTCEMTVDGVPYSSLNSAAKMQAGLDVIHSLSKLYDASVPVWLDNRESVSEIPEVDCQIINLFVSAADEKLRVEVA